jgi:hypothetical protein
MGSGDRCLDASRTIPDHNQIVINRHKENWR